MRYIKPMHFETYFAIAKRLKDHSVLPNTFNIFSYSTRECTHNVTTQFPYVSPDLGCDILADLIVDALAHLDNVTMVGPGLDQYGGQQHNNASGKNTRVCFGDFQSTHCSNSADTIYISSAVYGVRSRATLQNLYSTRAYMDQLQLLLWNYYVPTSWHGCRSNPVAISGNDPKRNGWMNTFVFGNIVWQLHETPARVYPTVRYSGARQWLPEARWVTPTHFYVVYTWHANTPEPHTVRQSPPSLQALALTQVCNNNRFRCCILCTKELYLAHALQHSQVPSDRAYLALSRKVLTKSQMEREEDALARATNAAFARVSDSDGGSGPTPFVRKHYEALIHEMSLGWKGSMHYCKPTTAINTIALSKMRSITGFSLCVKGHKCTAVNSAAAGCIEFVCYDN